jgi:hypothetical protein
MSYKQGDLFQDIFDNWKVVVSAEEGAALDEYGYTTKGYVFELRDATQEEIDAELAKPVATAKDFLDFFGPAWDKLA